MTRKEQYERIVRPRMVRIWFETNAICPVCGAPFMSESEIQLEHIWPRTVPELYNDPENMYPAHNRPGCKDYLDYDRHGNDTTPKSRIVGIKALLPWKIPWLRTMAKRYRFPLPDNAWEE